jgi:hypothetical protein
VRKQLESLGRALAPASIVMTTWFSAAFVDFCHARRLRFLSFAEESRDHWYHGSKLGLAFSQFGAKSVSDPQ